MILRLQLIDNWGIANELRIERVIDKTVLDLSHEPGAVILSHYFEMEELMRQRIYEERTAGPKGKLP